MRVVLDTNVIVSGLLSPYGSSAQIITHWLRKEFILLYTPAMYDEYQDVLNRTWLHERLANVPKRIPEFIQTIHIFGELVKGYVNVTGTVRDPFDEMFLVCAILGNADYIISGDKDLLSLDSFRETKIAGPTEFLVILQKNLDQSERKT